MTDQTLNIKKPRSGSGSLLYLVVGAVLFGGLIGGLLYLMWLTSTIPSMQFSAPAAVSVTGSAKTSQLTAEEPLDLSASPLGSSTEIADIEKDLRSLDLNGPDSEMGAIERELQ